MANQLHKNLVSELMKRDGQMDMRQSNWRNAWQDLATYMVPNAKDITTVQYPGRVKNREVFDSTAIEAASRLAGSLTGIVTSPSTQWFNFTFGEGLLELGTDSLQWLQNASLRTFLALQRSNFSVEMLMAHLQLVVFGTTALYIREHPLRPGEILFETLPIGTYRIQEGIDRRVDTIHKDVEISLKQLVQHAEEDGWDIHPDRIRAMQRDPFQQIEVLHCIYPKTQVLHELDTDEFTSVYIDKEKKHLMAVEGFKELPIVISRWMVSGRDEEYGRSPGFKALPDVLTLNRAEEIGLRSWAKAVDPPVLALHQSVLGTPDLRPSQLTYILEQGALAPFPHNPNVNVDMVNRERKVQMIRSIFLQDLIQFLPGEGLTPPTATQINAQMDILLQVAGPELTRQEYEMYDPTISRVFKIQQRSGEIPPPTAEIAEWASLKKIPVDVKFDGPIARAKRRDKARAIDTMLAWAGNMAQIYPTVLHKFNSDRAAEIRSELEGMPLEILTTDEEVDQIRRKEEELRQQQAQQQQIVEGSQIAKNLGGADGIAQFAQ